MTDEQAAAIVAAVEGARRSMIATGAEVATRVARVVQPMATVLIRAEGRWRRSQTRRTRRRLRYARGWRARE